MTFHDPIEEWPPTKGPEGAAVVSFERTVTSDVQHHRVPPPSMPEREKPVFAVDFEDEDGEPVLLGYERLTDDEWAEALRRYELARAEWRANNGVYTERGPITERVEIRCADGSTPTAVGGVFGGGRSGGRWVKYKGAPKEQRA